MSILVLSDTHGLVQEVKQVVDRHPAELMLHCGDFCVDRRREPFARMELVRGNCDTDDSVPLDRQIKYRDLRIYQTHGHLYGVKSSLQRLHYRAEETGANVVLFGHSHFPLCTEERGILFLNPGSLQLPRGFATPTCAVIEQLESSKGGIEVEVTYFDHRGKTVKERGGRFKLRR
ncbi:YfcE family phosphodiesterase [Brevibacillus massiliensis]|uniref:YfcE family phosphodiesterase n=1 Tax=Brevibacillus massiliensis TaxID=1118054 RepID=UPI0002F4010E|nr:metallophosphoesterase [Brevibacillus massiliensis]